MSENRPGDIPPQEERPFIRETVIQDKTKSSFGRKLLYTSLLAFSFGIIAAFSFYLTQRFLTPRESVSSPSVSFEWDSALALQTSSSESESFSAPFGSGSAGTNAPSGEMPPNWQSTVESMINSRRMSLNDYRSLSLLVSNLTHSAQRSLVTVTATSQLDSSLKTSHQLDSESFGVIVDINALEVLILTPNASTMQLSDSSSLSVTFANLFTAGAYIKERDNTSDLMVMAVPKKQLNESTLSSIAAINLGNSYVCSSGQQVIAMGAPLGGLIKSSNSGVLTFVENGRSAADNTISLLYTSMTGDENSRGFLINLDGSLIGWIDPEHLRGGCLTAVGISDLKPYIENLSNGISSGYLGIEGQNLTSEIKSSLGLDSEGVYITRCLENSPALAAGLQNGDILIRVSGAVIPSVSALRSALLSFSTEQTVTITVLRRGRGGYRELNYDVNIERR